MVRNNEEVSRLKELLKSKEEECAKLINQLSKYELAAKGANDGLWDWDLTNNELFVSAPWKTMLGFDAEEKLEIEGLWEHLLHPEDKEAALNYIDSFLKGEIQDYYNTFRLKHIDGTYRWIKSQAKALRDKQGRAIRISGTHTDISETKMAQEELQKSEKKFRALFENSLVGMFRTDFNTGEILESNKKVWEILGIDPQVGFSTYDFYRTPEDRQIVIDAIKENGKAENIEIQIKKGDGTPLWLLFSVQYYAEENVLETIVIDNTERKNNLLELQKVNFELDSFVYHASHDLRSPLRSVMGLLNIYHEETNPSSKADCIEMIEGSIKRLDNLVVELLSISRNDRIDDVHAPLNFIVEINNSISSYFNASNTKNLDIRVRVIQPVSFVSDITRVRIILNNLISNAIKYRDATKPMSIIEIDVEVNSTEAKIVVEDNGEGIIEGKLGSIFDMFFRATEKSEGSGLGLYIVKNVVDKLNAEIKVESQELEGSTFTVIIPNTAS